MRIERQKAMVKGVAKNMRAKEREQAKADKARAKLVKILDKTGKALDEITKAELTKKDHEYVIAYVKDIMKCPLELYPNLK